MLPPVFFRNNTIHLVVHAPYLLPLCSPDPHALFNDTLRSPVWDGGIIQGNYGMSGTSTATGQNRSNPLGGLLSGALAGGGMGMQMSNSGWGGLLGAGLGGLLGLFI